MSHHLCEPFMDKIVTVVTHDGRNVQGTLRGVDQAHNLILEETVEKFFSVDSGVEIVSRGVFVIRGPNVAIIGLVDTEKDSEIDWDNLKAEPLKPVVH
mmetsp:Transcript_3690/g.11024  ORF Transcript_3690/g.11024 Transcript_3690/m.11024 type:complete len:98 (+) Transcript_3690:203-496(+)